MLCLSDTYSFEAGGSLSSLSIPSLVNKFSIVPMLCLSDTGDILLWSRWISTLFIQWHSLINKLFRAPVLCLSDPILLWSRWTPSLGKVCTYLIDYALLDAPAWLHIIPFLKFKLYSTKYRMTVVILSAIYTNSMYTSSAQLCGHNLVASLQYFQFLYTHYQPTRCLF